MKFPPARGLLRPVKRATEQDERSLSALENFKRFDLMAFADREHLLADRIDEVAYAAFLV